MFIYDNEFEKKELLLGLGTTSSEDNVEASLTELNDLVASLGISFLHDTTSTGGSIIKIQFDTKQIEKCKKRNAGRPRNYKATAFTYGDIHTWRREGKTTKEIIEILDCSRATYYRRLKEAQNWNTTDDTRWLG